MDLGKAVHFRCFLSSGVNSVFEGLGDRVFLLPLSYYVNEFPPGELAVMVMQASHLATYLTIAPQRLPKKVVVGFLISHWS